MRKFQVLLPEGQYLQVEAEDYRVENSGPDKRIPRVIFRTSNNRKVAEFVMDKIVGFVEVTAFRENNPEK